MCGLRTKNVAKISEDLKVLQIWGAGDEVRISSQNNDPWYQ